jgi:hypothetical protein
MSLSLKLVYKYYAKERDILNKIINIIYKEQDFI